MECKFRGINLGTRIIQLVDLTAKNAIDFCNNDYNFEGYKEVIYDHSHLGTVEPLGMLLVGSKIRGLFHKYPEIEFKDKNFEDKDYAAHMGFFKSVYLNYGNSPGEASGSTTYIPITELEVKKLRIESYDNTEEVQETIERKASQLAKVLSRKNSKLHKYLTYSIRELMRNIVEHSESKSIWFAGQYWPTKDRVEISILDEGVGIKQALSVNPNLRIGNDRDSLLLSLEPGISGKAFKYRGKMRKQEDTIWRNSGYGLFVTSSLCLYGGDFLICSGESALLIKGKLHGFKDTNFKGTAIRMRLTVSKINQLSEELIEEIVNEGEMRARDHAGISVITASKVSRILTIND
jgi:hypothetical protein